MDELVAYAKKIYGVDGLPAGSYDNFITFIQEITEAARASDNSIVVASIPESDIEIGGEAGKTAGYIPGALTADELLFAVPQLAEFAPIEAIQICNVNSDDITAEVWLTLANKINELADDPDVKGFVITHGTDTMEETAYFLNLTVKTNKIIGSLHSINITFSASQCGKIELIAFVSELSNPLNINRLKFLYCRFHIQTFQKFLIVSGTFLKLNTFCISFVHFNTG